MKLPLLPLLLFVLVLAGASANTETSITSSLIHRKLYQEDDMNLTTLQDESVVQYGGCIAVYDRESTILKQDALISVCDSCECESKHTERVELGRYLKLITEFYIFKMHKECQECSENCTKGTTPCDDCTTACEFDKEALELHCHPLHETQHSQELYTGPLCQENQSIEIAVFADDKCTIPVYHESVAHDDSAQRVLDQITQDCVSCTNKQDQIVCEELYANWIDSQCNPKCAHGSCVDGQCICDEEFIGNDCSKNSSDYSIQFGQCVSNHVDIRFCPLDSCDCHEINSTVHQVPLEEYLETVIGYHWDHHQEMCRACEDCTELSMARSNDYFQIDVDCDTCADECEKLENIEEYSYLEASEFLECQMIYDPENDRMEVPLYAGPMCAENGTEIRIRVFTDEDCTQVDLSKDIEDYLHDGDGNWFKLSNAIFGKAYSVNECVPCQHNGRSDKCWYLQREGEFISLLPPASEPPEIETTLCSPECGEHGSCNDGRCVCNAGFVGEDCSIAFDDALANYFVKFDSCRYETETFPDTESIRQRRFVNFRLCPDETCGSCESDSMEYSIDLGVYVRTVVHFQKQLWDEMCQTCESVCGEDSNDWHDDWDDMCYTCVDECYKIEHMEVNGYLDATNFIECQKVYDPKFDDMDWGDDALYVGPICASNGTKIKIGVFLDEGCDLVSNRDVDDYLVEDEGYSMKLSHALLRTVYSQDECVAPCGTKDEDTNVTLTNEVCQELLDKGSQIALCPNGLICYNGAECISALVETGNETDGGIASEYFCDCATARSQSTVDQYFTGQRCEYSSTAICHRPQESLNATFFCVNGGVCNESNETGETPGCWCPEGFWGDQCQFASSASALDSCPDDCSGNGSCVDGRCLCYPGFIGTRCSDDISAYEVKFGQCVTITEDANDEIRSVRYAVNIQFCPSGSCNVATCNIQSTFQSIDLRNYIEIMVDYHWRRHEDMCRACHDCTEVSMARSSEHSQFDVDCATCADECEKIENMEENGFIEASEFAACQMIYDPEDDLELPLYAGPMCAENGEKIRIGVFLDKDCTQIVLSKDIEDYLIDSDGYWLILAYPIFDKAHEECAPCKNEGSYNACTALQEKGTYSREPVPSQPSPTDLPQAETLPCSPECSEYGSCVEGRCRCNPGFMGVDCSTPLNPKDLSDYSIKYGSCTFKKDTVLGSDSTESIRVKRSVDFRFCAGDTCSSCESNFMEYSIDLTSYLETVVALQKKRQDDLCSTCESVCGHDHSSEGNSHVAEIYHSCDTCVDICSMIENMEENGYLDATNFIHCQKIYDPRVDNKDWGDDALYAGPICASNGMKIKIGVFLDEGCNLADSDKAIDDYIVDENGYSFKLSHALLMTVYSADQCIATCGVEGTAVCEALQTKGTLMSTSDCLNGVLNQYGHCLCKPGFAGSDCSIPAVVCPDGTTACFNGGKCVGYDAVESDEFYYWCDCLPGFKGEYCQDSVEDQAPKVTQLAASAAFPHLGRTMVASLVVASSLLLVPLLMW